MKNDLKSSAYAGDWLSDFALVAIYTEDSNLVDSASSHTLVSKIKPCMCKYKILYRNCGRLIISVIVYLIIPYYLDNRSNSRANTCNKTRLAMEGLYLLDISRPSSDVFGES